VGRVHTDTGLYGIRETFPAPDPEKAIIQHDYAPVLLGRDPRDIERIWLDPLTHIQYRGWAGAEMRALSAIDVALWDPTLRSNEGKTGRGWLWL
jgi:galactonate dehydratase